MTIVFQNLFKPDQPDPSAPKCPRCEHVLAPSEINVAADTALCAACGTALRFSDIVASRSFMGADPARPPKGASFYSAGGGFTVQATTRSWEAFLLVPFMCVWSGFSLNGIYGTQIRKGVFDLSSSLLGLPFLMGTFLFGGMAIMRCCGRIVVTKENDEGAVFEGVGPIGWTRRFRWSDVESIRESETRGGRGGVQKLIALDFRPVGRDCLKFGTLLTAERRWYIIAVLRSQTNR
jgi:hypothetical protein